jgi:inhibitor of cysteine peptidase
MRRTDWRGHAGHGYLTLAVLVAAMASICAGSRGAIAAAGNRIRVADADNGRAVTMARGDTLVVSLASTPGTGFGWKVAKVRDQVLRVNGAPELIHAPNPRPGAPATQVFRFKATGRGSTRLELEYVRPWEHGTPSARTFDLGVTVR